MFDELKAWCSGNTARPFRHGKFDNLHREALTKRTLKGMEGRTPDSPLCDAVAEYAAALAEYDRLREARQAALLHRLRDDARRRVRRHKQQARVLTYDDLIDRVADALAGGHGDALADRLRAQYRIALVDEFQDTDPRQWQIFNRVFGAGSDDPALFLIGDPKQAIYGFRGGDVETYLAAKRTADEAPSLSHNFRSRPAVLRSIEALYGQAQAAHANEPGKIDPPFIDPRIRFHPVQPGGKRDDGEYRRNGAPAPALTLWQAPEPSPDDKGKVKPYTSPQSRALATEACVAAIHGVLTDARAGRATIKGEPVRPGDIAVLVRKHSEAIMIRDALAAVGIPAVAAGRRSLFATPEARELHTQRLQQGVQLARLGGGEQALPAGGDRRDADRGQGVADHHRLAVIAHQ